MVYLRTVLVAVLYLLKVSVVIIRRVVPVKSQVRISCLSEHPGSTILAVKVNKVVEVP